MSNKHRTLIIFDWDDTLFPTSWLVKNGIDLTNNNTQQQYIVLFSSLDLVLYNLLNTLTLNNQVVIITNAVKKWVELSTIVLPKTGTIITKYIPIVSARDLYKQQYPEDMTQWKKHTFKNLVHNYYKNSKSQNIISVGDAEYEFLATTNLYDTSAYNNNKLLKTVKLFQDPSFDSLLNQLKLLSHSFNKIISCNKHLDLKFKDNQIKL